jgi:replication factor A1
MADSSPVVAIKSLKVSDFQGMQSNLCSIFTGNQLLTECRDNCGAAIFLVGVSLSTVGKSTLAINPDLHEAQNLKSW